MPTPPTGSWWPGTPRPPARGACASSRTPGSPARPWRRPGPRDAKRRCAAWSPACATATASFPPRAARLDQRRAGVLVSRARAGRPAFRRVRRQRDRQRAAVRRRPRDRRRGARPGSRDDRGRRDLPARRRVVLGSLLLRSLPDALAHDSLLRHPGQPRLRGPGRPDLLRDPHPAAQRPGGPCPRVELLARAGRCAADRPRHQPERGALALAVDPVAQRARAPSGDLPHRVPAPHAVLLRPQFRGAPLAAAARPARPRLHLERDRYRLQRPRPLLRAHAPDRRRHLRDDRRRRSARSTSARRPTPSRSPSPTTGTATPTSR